MERKYASLCRGPADGGNPVPSYCRVRRKGIKGLQVFEHPPELRCTQVRTTLRGGASNPALVQAVCQAGNRHEFVMKWRIPDGGPDVPGLCAAAELACSIVARTLGLNVPDYALVLLSSQLADLIEEPELRAKAGKNVGINFGCRYIPGSATWIPDYKTTCNKLLCHLENCVSFDASVMNGDRTHAKPNLLWVDDSLVLIDHALAAQPWRAGGDNDALFPQESIRTHAAYASLSKRARGYSALYDDWARVLSSDFWEELNGVIPGQWRQDSRGEVERMIEFFRQRVTHLANQTMELRGVLQ